MQEKRKSKRFVLEANIAMERVDGSKNRLVPINVIDVSGSGIGFSCREILEMNSVYKINLKIWTGDVVDALIHIIRFDNSNDNMYVYGANFVGMPGNDTSKFDIHELFEAANGN
ncbi:MAG: PilZ domain-containing protein [Lachnospiraceae bacterium]|nr:PilZ domain-containing protein [Lachnospiraceae bacterium]